MSSHPDAGPSVPFQKVSARIERVQSPVIPVVADLIRRHPGTLSLGQGVVFYGPPSQAVHHMLAGLADPEVHKYKAVVGIPPLIEILSQKVSLENRISMHSGRSLVVTAGGNLAFYNALLAVTDAGDEVILQTPYYFNHEMAVVMANARPVLVPTDASYHLQPDLIEAAITPGTRAVVTVSPNNPTGAVYGEPELRAVNEICRCHGLYHIHDEAYENFVWEGREHVSPASFDASQEHTICLYSLSKAYGFASWRIGYMVIPDHLLEGIRKIQDTLLICAPVVSQLAAIGALQTGSSYCRASSRPLLQNRATLLGLLPGLGGDCQVSEAEGAFYIMLRLRRNWDSLAVVGHLVKKYGVAVIPGTAFGMVGECSLRVAYGAIEGVKAETAFQRLALGLKEMLSAPGSELFPTSC